MIGGVVRHGRTGRDARLLGAHLLKGIEIDDRVEIRNSVAPDLAGVLDDMQIARDGSRADAAFLHMHLSPSRSMTDDEMRRAADIVLAHFGATEHASALIFHEKDRNGGAGDRHAHLVVGRVGPGGTVLPAGFEIIRMETAMRLVEHELGEPATLGRHHESAARWMRSNGRADVADWLDAAHGSGPKRPDGSASPRKRAALVRDGVDLSAARAAVQAAWERSDGHAAFRGALAVDGLSLAPGKKDGVWIVRAGDDVEVGALDRLVKQKRGEVAARMRGFEHGPAPETIAESGRRDLPVDARDARRREGTPSVARAPRSGDGREAVADRGAEGAARDDHSEPAPVAPGDRGPDDEGRRDRSRDALAAAQLGRADWNTLRQSADALRDVLRPAVDRMRDRIGSLRQAARARLSRAAVVPPERPDVLAAREALRTASKASHEAFYGSLDRERAVAGVLRQERPAGLWARVAGRSGEWDRAAAVRDEIQVARDTAHQARSRAEADLGRLERLAAPGVTQDRARREREADSARQELRLLSAADACLVDDPHLARQGLGAVLRRAQEQLDRQEDERRRLVVEGHQHDAPERPRSLGR